jgi:hypothetical protein
MLPHHSPSLIDSYPLNSPPPFYSLSRPAIDGHGRRGTASLRHTSLYKSSQDLPRPPFTPHSSLPASLLSPLRPNRARRRCPLKPAADIDLHRHGLPRHSLGRLSFIVWSRISSPPLLFLYHAVCMPPLYSRWLPAPSRCEPPWLPEPPP